MPSESTNILSLIADNPQLFKALETLLLEKSDFQVYNMPTGLSFEQLGMWTTTRIQACQILIEVLKEIEKYKTQKDSEKEINTAV